METLVIAEHTGAVALLREHRERWSMALAGADAVDLSLEDDPAAALSTAAAAVWPEGYDEAVRPALVEAAGRGARLVVCVPDGAEARDLARALGGDVVPQALAAGSVIGTDTEARVRLDTPARPEYALAGLVCANVDVASVADARLGFEVATELAARVARLEQSLAALQETNVRLSREHLGRHDAAAASVIGKLERAAEEWERRFHFEQELAQKHHDWFMSAQRRLQRRRYRAVDKLFRIMSRIPLLKRI